MSESSEIPGSLMRKEFTQKEAGFVNTNPSGISFFALISEDFRTHGHDLFSQGFWALFWQRFGNWRMALRWKVVRFPATIVYRFMYRLSHWFCGIDLPYSVIVGRRVKLEHFGGMILIAERIGDDVIIRHNTTFGIASLDTPKARPSIGNGVEIGTGAVIIGQVVIGDGAVVGANAVVVRDVRPGTIVGGVPARELPQVPAKQIPSSHG